MKIILTEEQLIKIHENLYQPRRESSTKKTFKAYVPWNYLNKKSKVLNDNPTNFYNDCKDLSVLLEDINHGVGNIYLEYLDNKVWDGNPDRQKLSGVISNTINKLKDIAEKYLVSNENDRLARLNDRVSSDMGEQIDTEDEENELMKSWYGDDSFDEYGSLDGEDDEDNEEVELDFNYAPEYDVDSDDSYDLSRDNDLTNRMKRSVRVGAAGAVDRDTKRYVIDGKGYSLTPVEYRQMLKDMNRMTPEKAANMGIEVDTSGVIKKGDDDTRKKIKYLEKRIKTLQNDLNRWEPEIDPNYKDDKLEWKVKYIKASLETAMDEYDELTGNVDGEEYNF
jgi:hypothetical protein